MQNNRKVILFSALGIVLFIILLVVWGAHLHALSGKLTLEVAPSGSDVILNDSGVTEGTIRVRPGEQKITVTRKGFATYNQTITIKPNETQYTGVSLVSNDPSTSNWYVTHPKDQKKAEGISSKNFDQSSKQTVNANPIVKDLPFIDDRNGFRVDYGASQLHPHDSHALAIIITTDGTEESKQAALGWLRFSGYDPSKLELIYKTY